MAKQKSQPPALKADVLKVCTALFENTPSKAERRMVQILEGAIETYVAKGFENTTFYHIADTCRISRPLIQHYFKEKEDLFLMVSKYIRVNFQQLAVDAISSTDSPVQQLKQYVASLFEWIDRFPNHAKVWLLVWHRASVDDVQRAVHTELSELGHRRIIALLKAGHKAGKFSGGQFERRAKMIQTLYSGGLVIALSENLYVERAQFEKQLIQSCLDIAVFPSSKK